MSKCPDHYLGRTGTQPVHLIRAFQLGFDEGAIIKYVTRWRRAGSLRDLLRAQDHLEALIEEAKGHPRLGPDKEDYERAEKLYALPPDPEEIPMVTVSLPLVTKEALARFHGSEQERTFAPLVEDHQEESPVTKTLPTFIEDAYGQAARPTDWTTWPDIVRENMNRYEWLPYSKATGRQAGWHLHSAHDGGRVRRYDDPESGYRRELGEPEAEVRATAQWVPYDFPRQILDPGPEEWARYGVKSPTYFWVGAGGRGGGESGWESGWARNAGR
jgi:hypothetical protein